MGEDAAEVVLKFARAGPAWTDDPLTVSFCSFIPPAPSCLSLPSSSHLFSPPLMSRTFLDLFGPHQGRARVQQLLPEAKTQVTNRAGIHQALPGLTGAALTSEAS